MERESKDFRQGCWQRKHPLQFIAELASPAVASQPLRLSSRLKLDPFASAGDFLFPLLGRRLTHRRLTHRRLPAGDNFCRDLGSDF